MILSSKSWKLLGKVSILFLIVAFGQSYFFLPANEAFEGWVMLVFGGFGTLLLGEIDSDKRKKPDSESSNIST